jgi:hypothetical protein
VETTKIKAVIPHNEFQRIYAALPESRSCREKGCAYSRTTCHVRECREYLREWWKRTNGTAPGFVHYERVLQNAIDIENALYWCFWTRQMEPCEKLYELLCASVRDAFMGKPLDMERTYAH